MDTFITTVIAAVCLLIIYFTFKNAFGKQRGGVALVDYACTAGDVGKVTIVGSGTILTFDIEYNYDDDVEIYKQLNEKAVYI